MSLNDLDHDIPSIESVHVVNDFLYVFPDVLLRVTPPREIDFGIDMEPDINEFQFLPTKWLQLNSKS